MGGPARKADLTLEERIGHLVVGAWALVLALVFGFIGVAVKGGIILTLIRFAAFPFEALAGAIWGYEFRMTDAAETSILIAWLVSGVVSEIPIGDRWDSSFSADGWSTGVRRFRMAVTGRSRR